MITRPELADVRRGGLHPDLELRFQKLRRVAGSPSSFISTSYPRSSCINANSSKKVCWADTAGLALTHVAHFSSVDSPLATGSSDALRQRSQDKQHPDHKHLPVEDSLQMNSAPAPLKKTYKEALLSPATPATKPPSLPFPPRSLIAPLNWSSTLSKVGVLGASKEITGPHIVETQLGARGALLWGIMLVPA